MFNIEEKQKMEKMVACYVWAFWSNVKFLSENEKIKTTASKVW